MSPPGSGSHGVDVRPFKSFVRLVFQTTLFACVSTKEIPFNSMVLAEAFSADQNGGGTCRSPQARGGVQLFLLFMVWAGKLNIFSNSSLLLYTQKVFPLAVTPFL